MNGLVNWGTTIKSEQGSAIALVAIGMVVMIGAAALALDAGLLFINRARLVNALDSAVLAGAQYLPNDPDLALQTAHEFAQLNGAAQDECDFQLGASNCSISGQADRQVALHFARIFSQDSGRVEARAAAKVAPISSVMGIVPFGVLEDNFEFGRTVTLKAAAGENEYAGWFGALCLTGNGANDYEDDIIKGYDGQISIGDIIQVENGNMSGPTKDGIEYRIDQCTHSPCCTVNSFQEGCSRILIVPIVNIQAINNGGHPESIKVVGFAAFLVTEYTGSGDENTVKGAFVRYIATGDTEGTPGDYGLYSAYLYE